MQTDHFFVRAIDCTVFSQSQLLVNNYNFGLQKPHTNTRTTFQCLYDFWIVHRVINSQFKQKCYL